MSEALAAAAAYVLGASGVRALTLGFSTSRAYTCLTVTALTERMVIDWPWCAHSRSVFRRDLCSEWLAANVDYLWHWIVVWFKVGTERGIYTHVSLLG